MTILKDELLKAGLPEEKIDEIISLTDSEEITALDDLKKAVGDEKPEMDPLAKAGEKDEKSEEDDDEKEYDEKFMKKHMKRYMKENKKECGKMAKEVGMYGEDMKKAIDEFDTDSEGAVIEMTDLKPILEQFGTAIESMSKAIPELAGRIELVSAQNDESFDIMKKAAVVTVGNAEAIATFMSIPKGKKSVSAPDAQLQKAQGDERQVNQEVYQILMKATIEGNKDAGQVLSVFESHGKNINRLNTAQKGLVDSLRTKENK